MNETQKKITLKTWMWNTWFTMPRIYEGFKSIIVFHDAVTANLTIGEIDLEICKPTKQFYDFFEELETIKNK